MFLVEVPRLQGDVQEIPPGHLKGARGWVFYCICQPCADLLGPWNVPKSTRGHPFHINKTRVHILAENAEQLGNCMLQRDLLMDASILGSQIIWRQSF